MDLTKEISSMKITIHIGLMNTLLQTIEHYIRNNYNGNLDNDQIMYVIEHATKQAIEGLCQNCNPGPQIHMDQTSQESNKRKRTE